MFSSKIRLSAFYPLPSVCKKILRFAFIRAIRVQKHTPPHGKSAFIHVHPCAQNIHPWEKNIICVIISVR